MSDQENTPKHQVSLDELLRLKRAERPGEDFWNQFDRELHQRMLQSLVKKDPWYVQLLRGISGRIAQTTAVGAAAAFLATMVIQPALVQGDPAPGSAAPAAQMAAQAESAGTNAVGASGIDALLAGGEGSQRETTFAAVSEVAERDYGMETVAAVNPSDNIEFTPEYAPDSIAVATYHSSAYMADTATFAGSGIATGLVY